MKMCKSTNLLYCSADSLVGNSLSLVFRIESIKQILSLNNYCNAFMVDNQ